MDEQTLANNITNLLERVRLSAEKSQRRTDDILLLAVSKTRSAPEIRAAHAAGLRHFGESYLQEALDKILALQDLDLVWHFVGPIQSNKTRAIAAHFHWVHSVDRLKIARRLSAQRPLELPPLQVCLQVNISGEASKSGVAPAELPELARAVSSLPQLELRGLMAIPNPAELEQQQRRAFAQVREALVGLRAFLPQLDTLSMGMSADLEAAIAEGATIVRPGTAVFGPRDR
jgi:pyridoxal phosphate enzyme (YggS family)